MASRFGMSNPNYRHGNYCGDFGGDNCVQIGIAKDLLRRILNTPCDSRGELPFTKEEQVWAMRVIREKPEWAVPVLKENGIIK